MPVCTETIHHASGTVEKGAVLPADHPVVKAAPGYFTADTKRAKALAEAGFTPEEAIEIVAPKRGRK